jgi:hypothetical protein
MQAEAEGWEKGVEHRKMDMLTPPRCTLMGICVGGCAKAYAVTVLLWELACDNVHLVVDTLN